MRGLSACLSVIVLAWASGAWGQDLTSTSSYALSFQNQRQVVRAASGTIAMAYQKGSPAASGGGLVLVVSRDDGRTWSAPLSLVTISNVFADVAHGPGDDLYVVYSKNSDSLSASADVGFLKLAYDAGSDTWSVARRTVVYDANSTTAGYNGVVAWDGLSLWAAYRFRDSAGFRIVVKHSADDGLSWQDAITVDTPGPNADETAAFTQIGNRLALIYYHQDAEFRWRWHVVGDAPAQWQPSELIYRVTQSLPSKSAYSIATDDQGGIHLLFSSRGVQYLRYGGAQWDSSPTLLDAAGTLPTIGSDGQRLWAAWLHTVGSSQTQVVVSAYDPLTGAWASDATVVSDPSERLPARAWCFSSAFAGLSDVTLASGNTTSGDVKHVATKALLRDNGDGFYFGQEVPFDYLRVQLKVKGIGGQVGWEYWNGAAWAPVAPYTGRYDFTKSNLVWLWAGLSAVPPDWQEVAVGDDTPLYYVRARVTTPFGTSPVGTQITSVKRNDTPTTIARDSTFRFVAWLQRIVAPYAVMRSQPTP